MKRREDRIRPSSTTDPRKAFQRDRDRVLYSPEFRRLSGGDSGGFGWRARRSTIASLVPLAWPVGDIRHITCYDTEVIRSYRHRGLRRAHQCGSYYQVNATYADRIARVIATLQAATKPSDLDLPGYRLHPLKGNMEGFWSIRVSANWRIIFWMDGVHVYDVDLVDYH